MSRMWRAGRNALTSTAVFKTKKLFFFHLSFFFLIFFLLFTYQPIAWFLFNLSFVSFAMFFFLWQILSFQCSLALSKNSSHACSFAPRGSLSILLNFSLDVLLITVAVNSRRRNKLWSFKKLLRFTRVYNRRMLDDRLVYMIWRLLWKHGGEKLLLPIYLSTTVFIA